MRMPLLAKAAPRTRVSESVSIPAPLGGWNARDALADMDKLDAVVLENWFPKTSYVEIRGGLATHASGMTGNGKTLAVHNGLSGANKMFCLTASGVYDVSAAGTVGASVASRTEARHQQTMFGDGTNNWLILVNGVDKPLYYDGSTWTAVDGTTSPALTGLTTTDIIGVNGFKGRLFFIQKNSLSFWYLPSGVAGGALTEFDLSAEAKRGGYLVVMATWTRDAGDGQDDIAVFITSEGEAILYQGNNPSVATSWAKIGTFFIGKPLGRRCVAQYGGDVIVLTQNGTFPLSAALATAAVDSKTALSFKIENAFTEAARLYGANFGWEATVYPAQGALLVNVPIGEDREHEQYVMNTITKSWCKFKTWNVEAFAIYNNELYGASLTTVYKAWTGQSDLAANIQAYSKTAFSYLGERGTVKKVKLFRPVFAVNGNLSFQTDIDIDFLDTPMSAPVVLVTIAGGIWDQSFWDQQYWNGALAVVKYWTSPAEWEGYCVAGKVKVATNFLTVQWMSSDYIFERGGML